MHLLIIAVVVVVVVCLLIWLIQTAPIPLKQASLLKWLLEAIVVLIAVGILLREAGLLSSIPK